MRLHVASNLVPLGVLVLLLPRGLEAQGAPAAVACRLPDGLLEGDQQTLRQEEPVNQAAAAANRNLAESPTRQPTNRPTTKRPTTKRPTTKRPTTKRPTTKRPTTRPTRQPTTQRPTKQPTSKPTPRPTRQPTRQPTRKPTSLPTATPTAKPTAAPTSKPTAQPTATPTDTPTATPTSEPTAQEISKQAAEDAKAYALQFSAIMAETYPADLRVPGCNCLANTGTTTDTQLNNFFRKCVTPGSTINLGILGGSISQFSTGYQVKWISRLKQMCPVSSINLYDGARSSTGSMTLGFCAKASIGSPEEVDLFVSEFTLNDGSRYTIDGAFNSQSYEFLLRNVITTFKYAPAIITLHFWGSPFVYESAQPDLVALAQRYKLSAISMRDAVWPYYTAQREPLATVEECTKDGIHPSDYVQKLAADLLHKYIVDKFLAWVDSAIDGTASMTAGTAPVALPDASNSRLNRYDVEKAKIDCAIVPNNGRDNGRTPLLIDPSGFEIDYTNPMACVKFTSDTAKTKVKVTTQTGRIYVSNCNYNDKTKKRIYGAELASAINVYNVVAGEWRPLTLSQMVDGVAEGFEVDPPLAPGTYTLGITKNPTCEWLACLKGFVAVAGL